MKQEEIDALAALAARAKPSAESLRKTTQTEARVLRDFAAVIDQVREQPSAEGGTTWEGARKAGLELAAGLARSMAEVVESHVVPLAVVAKHPQGATS